MPSDDSLCRAPDLKKQLALLHSADEGVLDHLQCPQCAQSCVSVWFTHPAPNEYRTWFVCENCNFETRAQNSGRPPFYSEERDRTAKASAS